MGIEEGTVSEQVAKRARSAALEEAARVCEAIGDVCEWTQMDPWDFSGAWDTACGHAFSFADGGPGEDGIDYCCYCGKKILPIKAQEPGDDDE